MKVGLWWWWLTGTLLLCHAEIERVGGGQHRETPPPLAERREVFVGQLVVMAGGR